MIFVINFVVLAFLSLLWKKSTWFNFSIKALLFALSCANAFYALQSFGYVVRV
jgi:hypothetical protein